MQLCALDGDETLVFAVLALKQKDYHCLECRETVRLRSGLHRRAHFFHVRPNGKCRLHAKGLPHLMVQYHLIDLLPTGEAEMECRFPSISRIADIAWHSQKIVYEIQYSPISPEEVMMRNAAYASIGYQVVWVMHEVLYNQFYLTAAEDVLKDSPHYYTDMNDKGEGMIYDQFACVDRGMRVFRLPEVPVDLSVPYNIGDEDFRLSIKRNFPRLLFKRASVWNMGFYGDTLDRLHRHVGGESSDEFDEQLIGKVKSIRDESGFGSLRFNLEYINSMLRQWVVRPYKIMLKVMLERACR